jgi:HEAT repeat protein
MRRASLGLVVSLVFFASAPALGQTRRFHFSRAQIQQAQVQQNEDDDDEPQQQEVIEESNVSPLRGRFGSDHAETLLRASESEDVRRGIARAASAGTPEAVTLLVAQADSPTNDDLTLIELARALAPFAKQEAPRQKLVQLLNATARSRGRNNPAASVSAARVELARQIAARALVASRDPKALDAIENAAREGGSTQENALRALASDPYAAPRAGGEAVIAPPTSAAAVRALAQSGDLRVLDALLAKSQGSFDAPLRAACMSALGALGDGRVRPIAIAAFADGDARVREAAGDALVSLDAPERFHAVTQLVGNDDTMHAGVRLAHRAQDGEVVKALAARFAATNDAPLRLEILAALGRGIATEDGLKVLASVAGDPVLGGDAVHAIARSPNAAAMATLERLALTRPLRRLAVRGYVVRALLRAERSSALDEVVDALRASTDSADRALAAFARVALRREDARAGLADRDAAVRRAAAMASLASYDGHTLPVANALLRRYTGEPDESTRAVLAIGLIDGDPDAIVPTRALELRIEAGGADAALSAAALAARKGDAVKAKLETYETSPDPIMRAHVARGLGASEEPSATGRLAEETRYEAEPLVRLAQITALARRPSAPSRNEMLTIAASYDPEARIRDVAARGLRGAPPPASWPIREVAWLRVATSSGAPPSEPMLGSYVTSEGIAIPIAFDADGYALVAGIPPGDGRVVLSPTLPR